MSLFQRINLAFFSALMLLITASTVADDNDYKSVQWQKVEFENRLKNKIEDVIGQVIERSKFFVDVNITAKSQNLTVPTFSLQKELRPMVTSRRQSTVSNDYILLDKIGLNAPLYEGNDDQRISDLQLKIYQYSKRVEREFLEKSDLFQNIEAVSVRIGIDNSVPENKKSQIKDLVQNLIPKFENITPTVDILSLELHKEAPKSFYEDLISFTGPVGVIIATLLICVTSALIFYSYKKLRDEMVNREDKAKKKEQAHDEEKQLPESDHKVDPELRPGSPKLAEAISNTSEGVQRFCLYLEKSYDQATNLVKKWINLNTKVSATALSVLSERLSVEELFKVFMKLTVDERVAYRKATGIDMTIADKASGDKYIGQQVLEDIISVTVVSDKELQQLLVEITPAKAAKLVSENSREGSLLINLVGGDFLGKMFLLLDVPKTKELTSLALKVKELEFESSLSGLKQVLKKYVDDKYRNPFERRIAEVMKELDYIRSENLLDVLIDTKQFDAIEDVIRSSFPARLIDRLPAGVLKGIFKNMQIDAKVEFLACLDDDKRVKFIDKTTQAGTKGREVIEFELSRVLENVEAMEYVNSHKDDIYGTFVVKVQDKIKSDEITREAALAIAKSWFGEISVSSDADILSLAS